MAPGGYELTGKLFLNVEKPNSFLGHCHLDMLSTTSASHKSTLKENVLIWNIKFKVSVLCLVRELGRLLKLARLFRLS